MKITLTLDNAPSKESSEELRRMIKRRRINLLELCRETGLLDRYHQLHAWISGKPNQKHYKEFIKALQRAEIITEVQKDDPYRM